ncbi:MAG: hypothetical protein M0035_03165 [Actinomycetota bacterium]|nr:hypothetical protein [Actinomycetota bacterium]MDA8356245.1 hypothetical protein [Actinomycetota bacterium]
MPAGPGVRADRTARVLLGAAALWSAGLFAAALSAPFYVGTSASSSAPVSPIGASGFPATIPTQVAHTSATLVQVNGFKVLAPVSLPLFSVVVVAFALWRRRKNQAPGAGWLAWAVTALLVVFALLGMLSIGLFIVPVAVLVALACARSSDRSATAVRPSRTGFE